MYKDNERELPKAIREIVADEPYTINSVGMSGSEVRIYETYVLKIQPESEETDNEYHMVTWLKGFIPAPEILIYFKEDGLAYTLMTKVEGSMVYTLKEKDPLQVLEIIAKGLKMLWSVDVSECPYTTSRLENRLKAAEKNVLKDLVDVEDAEPETFGPSGFKDPVELLAWLKDNKPEEDLVLTHGDFCLPNVFIKDGSISGFIDLGKMGPADRWQDIAIVFRSLNHNYNDKYSDGKNPFYFTLEMLVDALGISWDEKKYRYYLLLDELF